MMKSSVSGDNRLRTSIALATLAAVLLAALVTGDTASAAQRDNTNPTIKLTRPAKGATYALKQPATAKYSCQDNRGGSGLKSCVGTVPNGSPIDTAFAGQKSFTVTATDQAGNKAAVTRTYTVSECTIFGTAGNDALGH